MRLLHPSLRLDVVAFSCLARTVLDDIHDKININLQEKAPTFYVWMEPPMVRTDAVIDESNQPDSNVFTYLLKTRAGINLQGADTVIIFDPNFNPQQVLFVSIDKEMNV
ncbi:hypothetical protein B0H16DRAFT_1729875 [Mycena metata]|uniref:Uncharacterized protein n=1 Tax=Mycena metata TaxID=1033252 RepID=A0AAD7N0C7_9AGAR|nr:hypothetical protein B0H16DRAFT_1729875 [Mycena metata]